tara:strand:+ start:1291 stop:1401 length:111 start_codon:yes stop_codon:yes gene_type:complete
MATLLDLESVNGLNAEPGLEWINGSDGVINGDLQTR